MTMRDARWISSAALGGVGLGLVAVWNAEIAAAGVLGAALLGGVLLASRYRPEALLRVGLGLVILADTKFRARDPLALIGGGIDAQIVFELLMYFLLSLMVVGSGAVRGPLRGRLGPIGLAPLAFTVLAVASTLWSVVPAITLVRGVQLLVLFALGFAAVRLLGPERALTSLFRSAVIYVLVFSAITLLVPSLQEVVPRGRFSWFSVHPISAGTLAGSAAIFLVADLLRSPRSGSPHGRLARWIALPALVAVLVATVSRGPIFAFGATLFLTLLLVLYRRLRTPALPLLAGALATLGFLLLPSASELLRIGESSGNPLVALLYRGQSSDSLVGLSGRAELWSTMSSFVWDAPLLGHGYMSSRGLLDGVAWSGAGYAHNALMQALLDLGLLGGALLCVSVASVVIPTREPAVATILFSAMVFLVINSVGDEGFAGAPGFETIVLFTCVLSAEHIRAPGRQRAARPVRSPSLEPLALPVIR
jgi:hypothetical protein